MSDSDSMSAEDLRGKLYHSLREKGLVDALKSQLRNRLVSELQDIGLPKSFRPDSLHTDEGSLLLKAANSLVVDHMRKCHYDYALSIFMPESGTTEGKVFTPHDLLQLLSISPHSKLYRHLASSSSDCHTKGFLWKLLCEVASICGNSSRDSAAQTEPVYLPGPSSLEEQFRKVDDHYACLGDDSKRKWQAVEERILSYQHELEERSRRELQLEMARFKENEFLRMRMEEKEKCRQEIEKVRREMDAQHKVKADALLERERHAIERLQKQQEIAEKETYTQRQSILEEIEAVRQRENDLRRKDESLNREHQLWTDKLKTTEDLVKRREDSARKAEIEYEHRLQEEVKAYKLGEQTRYMDRNKDLDYREIRVRENERRLSDELKDIQQVKDELRQKRREVNELEGDLTKSKHDLISLQTQGDLMNERLRQMTDYQILKEENISLKKELDNAKMRSAELTRDNHVERQKQEGLMREMTERASKPTPEVYLLQKELDKHRHDLKQERAIADHQRHACERRVQEEIDRNHELLRKYEEQTLQLKEMNRELNDLRRQLGHTKQALTNEVYRKPKSSLLSRSNSACDLSNVDDEMDGVDSSLVRTGVEPELLFSSEPIDHVLRTHEVAMTTPARSEDYSYSLDLVEDTKKRLRSLEREAETLEKNYRDFQYRMTTVTLDSHGPLGASANQSKVHFSGSYPPRQSTGKPQHSMSKRSVPNTTASGTRPVSSTPSRQTRPERRRAYSPPAHHVTEDHVLLNNSVSTVSCSSPVPLEVADRPRVRPLSLDDLEARPGSPSVVLVPGGSESAHSQASDTRPAPPPGGECKQADVGSVTAGSSPRASLPGLENAKIVSLDAAWGSNDKDRDVVAIEPVSLDGAWKSERRDDDRLTQEQVDREYEERRRQREEERQRKEEDAWRREQATLNQLQGKEDVAVKRTEEAEQKDKAEKGEESVDEKIDPVLLKYMEVVKQNREKEKEVVQKTVETWKGRQSSKEEVDVVSEGISAASDKSGGAKADVSDADFW